MDEEQQQFEMVWSSQQRSQRMPSLFQLELNACKKIEQELVEQYLQSTIDDIAGQCHDQYQNGVANQIFTVQFRKNQQVQFNSFIRQLYEKFQQNKSQIFDGQSPNRINIILLSKSQVRQIVLHMYIYLQQNPQFDLVVFVINSITDLDEHNIYCFEKGLKGKRFVVVLCTISNFESKHETGLQNFEKYHYKLYNSRDLFCKYLFCCLVDPNIKPYLPCDILALISDIDYYSISFHQSCRRFMFCLQRFLLLNQRERTYVQFESLVQLIQTTISDNFQFYPGVKNAHEKMLKVILDQREIYTISEKAIVYQIAFASGVSGKELLEEGDIINSIRDSLRKQLAEEERFAYFVEYLEERQESKQLVMRRKKSRADQLGIDTKKNITPKNRLQNQITRIIKDATVGIRQQAAAVKWEDINYELRIKPQLPYLIWSAWSSDEETSKLLEEVSLTYFAPLSKYLKMYEQQQQLGKGIYLIKCLQLAGLIEISKKHVKPIIYTTFFEKAKFSGTPK